MDDGGNSTINLGLWELFDFFNKSLNGTGYNNDVGNRHLINFMDDKLRQLEERVHRLETLLEKAKIFEPYAPEDLAQGEDELSIDYKIHQGSKNWYTASPICTGNFVATWNELFAIVAPCLIVEGNITDIENRIEHLIVESSEYSNASYCAFAYGDVGRTVIVQFVALSLIRPSNQKHSITDKEEYWTLTKYGHSLMLKLSPVKREN